MTNDDQEELKKKELCRINVFGSGSEASFIVHKFVPSKIEKELGNDKKTVTAFLDHTSDERGRCLLFARTALLIKTILTEEDFERESQKEKEELKIYGADRAIDDVKTFPNEASEIET